MKKPILNKWQIFFGTDPAKNFVYQLPIGWRFYEFGIIKLKSLPEPGIAIGKENYKGFWINFRFWLPFEIQTH